MQRFEIWLCVLASATASACTSLDTLSPGAIRDGVDGGTDAQVDAETSVDPEANIVCDDGEEVEGDFCDGVTDCEDGTDETSCSVAFECGNGVIVPSLFLCDTFDDCDNGADEPEDRCTLAHWLCDDGEPIEVGEICDGAEDCEGGEDEALCPVPGIICQFRNDYIETSQLCDGVDNCDCMNVDDPSCERGTDELDCPSDPRSALLCPDGRTVVPRAVFCDGTDDCGDGTDEDLCGPTFLCPGTGRVLPRAAVCDGKNDCGGSGSGADEASCQSGEFVCGTLATTVRPEQVCDGTGDCTAIVGSRDADEMPCGPAYRCEDSDRLVPPAALCDGNLDCPGEDDEALCFKSVFTCGDGKVLPARLVCDRTEDCADGSDESDDFCFPLFECTKGSSKVSRVRRVFVCDGVDDCPDGSDETNCEHATWDCDGDGAVQNKLVCDGVADCEDGSDESYCSAALQCSPEDLPQPVSYYCNGMSDCANGADEVSCL